LDKKPFQPGFLRIFFFLCFLEDFFTGTWFWRGLQEFLIFAAVTGFFLREFLRGRNSCIYSGFLRLPPDSAGFLFPPNAVWLWPVRLPVK
jgi:hypothetical protein